MKNTALNKGFKSAVLILLTVLVMLSMTACGEKDFEIRTDVTKSGIVMDIDNKSGNELSIGFAGGEVVIYTNKGTYTEKYFMGRRIPRGKSQIIIDSSQYEGVVESIEIPLLSTINERGLPDKELKNIVIYDNGKNLEVYEGKFSAFSSGSGNMLLGTIIAGVIIVVVIIIGIITIIKNKKASQQFNPFGGQNSNAFDMQQQMARDAHNRAVSDHQSFVDSLNHHQAISDAHSGMGFTPPPTPPTPPMGF